MSDFKKSYKKNSISAITIIIVIIAIGVYNFLQSIRSGDLSNNIRFPVSYMFGFSCSFVVVRYKLQRTSKIHIVTTNLYCMQ